VVGERSNDGQLQQGKEERDRSRPPRSPRSTAACRQVRGRVDGASHCMFPKSSRRRGGRPSPLFESSRVLFLFVSLASWEEARGEGEGEGEGMLHPEREAKGHDGALRVTLLTRERKKDSRKGPDGYVCQCVCVCVCVCLCGRAWTRRTGEIWTPNDELRTSMPQRHLPRGHLARGPNQANTNAPPGVEDNGRAGGRQYLQMKPV
jgi:hypothetical protein